MSAERIDAHHHLWRLDRGDYGWLTARMEPIFRDFEPWDLRPILDGAGVGRTILVQAAPTEAETDYLLGLAQAHDWIAGVVGWTDLAAQDAEARVEALARRPGLVGLRPMLQDLADTDWLARPDVGRALAAMARQGLVFDALVQPRHLAMLRNIALRHPGLKIVIDHAAKPGIALGRVAGWDADMRRLAADTGAFCKLSGMITEASDDWSVDHLRPFADVLLDSFGPERLIWGSDWPVVNMAGDYGRWTQATGELLRDLTDAERDAILGANARAVYGIG